MWRDENYFIKELMKDKTLHDVFMQLGNLSVFRKKNEEFYYFRENNQSLDELMETLTDELGESSTAMQDYIDKLIKWGLVKYVLTDEKGLDLNNGTGDKDVERLNFFVGKGLPYPGCNIILTGGSYLGCTGINLYQRIIKDKENEENEENDNRISNALYEILDSYNKDYEALEKKIEDANKELNNGVIKNIQVLSIFAGIISLLFANIMGIKEFAFTNVLGLLIINTSTVISIFALLLFSKWIIMGDKLDWTKLLGSAIVILILLIPIILILLKILEI